MCVREFYMPTYDYKCSNCDYEFEKILKISERKIPTENNCPNCNSQNCIDMCVVAPSLMNPLRVDGLVKPQTQFSERMQQIRQGLGKTKHNLKDHY